MKKIILYKLTLLIMTNDYRKFLMNFNEFF